MVLDRPNGQYNDWLLLNKVPHLRPGIVVVVIVLPLGHSGASFKCVARS
jgi:hypothetical protein